MFLNLLLTNNSITRCWYSLAGYRQRLQCSITKEKNMCVSPGHSLRKYTILATWKGSLQTRHGVTNIHLEFSVPWGNIWTWKIVIKLGRWAVRRFPAIRCLSVLRRSPTAFLVSVCRAVVAIRMETFSTITATTPTAGEYLGPLLQEQTLPLLIY
jgi:hypothetical protein